MRLFENLPNKAAQVTLPELAQNPTEVLGRAPLKAASVGPGLYLERGITNNLASGTGKSRERELAARYRAHVCFRHENERLISGSSNESGMATN
jgi:hypothetical protein